MKQLFQQLNQEYVLPEDLEKQILDSYDTIKLIMDVTDLFTAKFGESEMEMHLKIKEAIQQPSSKKSQPKNDTDAA